MSCCMYTVTLLLLILSLRLLFVLFGRTVAAQLLLF